MTQQMKYFKYQVLHPLLKISDLRLLLVVSIHEVKEVKELIFMGVEELKFSIFY